MRHTIEDVLVEAGLLNEGQLRYMRHFARHHGVCLARAAIDQGGVDEEAMASALAIHLRLPRLDLQRDAVDDDAVREVPFDLAEAHRLLPLTIDRSDTRRVIRVAMADPLDFDASEEIEMSTGCSVEPLVGRVSEIGDAVVRHYRGVITKMIPRRPIFGSALSEAGPKAPEPTTQRLHQIADEAPPELGLQALIEILADRGVIDRDTWVEAVRRLIHERASE
jgi:hypothetical protein